MNNANEYDVQKLVNKAKALKLVLAPCGRAFNDLPGYIMSVSDSSMTLNDALASDHLPPGPSLIVITGVEEADRESSPGEPHVLALLRERVMSLLEAGNSVIMLSRYPRLRFPKVPGSAILEDACHYFPPIRAVIESDPALRPLPSYATSKEEVSYLTELVTELGVPLAARVDQILYESSLSPSLALLEMSPSELDALHFAGLVTLDGGSHVWSIPGALSSLKEAVSNYLSGQVDPPRDLGEAFELLWRIERRLRSAIRRRAIGEWQKEWKLALTHPDYSSRILERAGEVAYNQPTKVANIRDPLEWLTLPELLALRASKTRIGELGMQASLWKRFAMDVIPARNQVSHMRFLKPGDIATLRQWNSVLIRELD